MLGTVLRRDPVVNHLDKNPSSHGVSIWTEQRTQKIHLHANDKCSKEKAKYRNLNNDVALHLLGIHFKTISVHAFGVMKQKDNFFRDLIFM